MKAKEFKKAEKHLNYFNNLSIIADCFGINNFKYRNNLTLDNGREWLLDQFEAIDNYEEKVSNAIEKAKNHTKTKELKGFNSGYSMGEYTAITIVSSFQGEEFKNAVIIEDNRSEYKGKNKWKPTHGYNIAIFKMLENGSIRFVKFDEKVK